ncbi:MAG: tRNA uridine-5-carboxymethylaminomethyl(34) synthesis enzyme MnmG [Phycisphaeraceae bacterium]|nr:tRNA uridine-5-carboxymethylaminomethyl(34) synthesis enzyme MnmG [Phycisphaeraceae bacterium]MCW5762654.1 tRNA uridine-5-carboxymethylaminomethyl(34) synthesis enzyme MnmG [Phycisphaeraceae bacterium]
MHHEQHKVIVVGGGHAGVEAAWAAANALGESGTIALVTLDASRIGEMSCNPAIGGLAKGQLVREIDAMGGLMGLVADATGIMFKVLNTSRGSAVHGPRCQSDKQAYARAVRALVASRPEIVVVEGSVEELLIERGGRQADRHVSGVRVCSRDGALIEVRAPAVVVTTGTFMRGLMHTGTEQTSGGRFGEKAAVGISGSLEALGFELGRLKTGTPPRLSRASIAWDDLPLQEGDAQPRAFSDLSGTGALAKVDALPLGVVDRFPLIEQVACRQTRTSTEAHEVIRANLHRAPMFSGQILSAGPRYCPSIEDKVVRFADRPTHGVFLEPESLETDWVYCNGIATSLPKDVQDVIVRTMPGCERAEILRYGYAVEYDMVRPHQISATCMTKSVDGLFLAGQINGTSGYEEAAAQGLVAGINAVRWGRSEDAFVMGRDEGYIGVLMDDLVTKTPREPYRMFTSRAEYRLQLRADNAADRLTPVADRLGLLATTELGRARMRLFKERRQALDNAQRIVAESRVDGVALAEVMRRAEYERADAQRVLAGFEPGVIETVFADVRYEPYVERERREMKRQRELEHKLIPRSIDWSACHTLRNEARQALVRFQPDTFGQASRLEGVTPADLTLMRVLVEQSRK